jgi:hypothetical protein
MGTRSLVAALLLIHVTKVTDAQAADQAGLPPPEQDPHVPGSPTSAASTSAAVPQAAPAPEPGAASQAAPAPESGAVPQALPAPTPPPDTVPPPITQASVPPPSTSDSWIGGPQQYQRPTLVEQVADLQRSVRELEEERQRQLKADAPTWAAHVNFLNLLFDEITVGVDYALLDRVQVTAQAAYLNSSTTVLESTGGHVGAGIRLYPASNGYRGWYVSPTVSFGMGAIENVQTGDNASARFLIAGVKTGHQWMWKPVMLRMGVGVDRVWFVSSEINGRSSVELNGWSLALDGAVGVAF